MDRRTFLATTAGAALATAAPAFAQLTGEDARLRVLLDQMFEARVDDSPRFATSLGLDKGSRAALKSRLDDYSATAKARRLEQARGWVTDLKAVDRDKLSAASKVDLDVVLYSNEQAVRNGDKYAFGDVSGNFSPYVISQRGGTYASVPDFLDSQHRITTAADAEAYLSRLSAFAGAMDNDVSLQTADVAAGVVPPDFVCDLALGQMAALRNQPADRTILVTSIVKKTIDAGIPGDWGIRAQKIVETEVFAALDRQIAAMRAVRAKAKPDTGVWSLPGGDAYYADAVKASTTTNYTPQEVHQLGLDQVAEITKRLDVILRAQGMTGGTVAQRLAKLNEDPRQVYPANDSGRARMIADLNVDVADLYKLLPRAFATLPAARVEVRRVPVFIQDGSANGYYQRASLDGSRPAAFYINLKETGDWPRYNLKTLAAHETIPVTTFRAL